MSYMGMDSKGRTLTSTKHLFAYKGDELADRLMNKISDFQDYCIRSGKTLSWQKKKDYYENKFYSDYEGLDILDAGEQGELLAIGFNHFRNIIRHMLNPIVSMVPSFTVSAVNNDLESRRSADIGKQVVNYYEKVKRYSKISKRVAEYALVYSVGFQVEEWNPLIGEVKEDKKTGKFRRDGDFDISAVSVWDMFYDYSIKENPSWFIFRKRVNKYDLAASFSGTKKEQIESLEPFYTSDKYMQNYQMQGTSDSDEVYVYSAYCKDSPAVEGGKYCLFCGSQDNAIHLYESKNIYKDKLPVFPMMPAQFLENFFGFTEASLLTGPQEFLNDTVSKIQTNAQSAIKDIWQRTGNNVTVEELSTGRNLIQSDEKPEVLDLYSNDNGLMQIMQLCKSAMETFSAQNSVIRGDVAGAPNLKSGIAIQTVIAMGQQFSHGLEAAYNELFEDVNTFRLQTLALTSDSERIISIVGKSNASNVIKFTKDDLKGISKVIVEQVNPILNSPAGRIEIANALLEKQLPGFGLLEYWDVIHTGNLNNGTELQNAISSYAAQVYDKILQGEDVEPIMGVDHQYVLRKILPLQYQASFRTDPVGLKILQAASNFIQKTMGLLREGDEIYSLVYQNQMPTQLQAPIEGISQDVLQPNSMPQAVPPNIAGGLNG